MAASAYKNNAHSGVACRLVAWGPVNLRKAVKRGQALKLPESTVSELRLKNDNKIVQSRISSVNNVLTTAGLYPSWRCLELPERSLASE